MIVGITGCPGSGKSLLAGIMAKQGWTLIDADEIGRFEVENSREMLHELSVAFGSDILRPDDGLDRKLLAVRAFAHSDNTKKLNRIVHPRLIARLEERINEARGKKEHSIVDCALIFEWEIERLFDIIICVAAEEHIRKKRLRERDRRTSREIEGMFSAQLPEIEKIRRSDCVIVNSGSRDKMTLFGSLLGYLNTCNYTKGCCL